jgi:hypothetical protein
MINFNDLPSDIKNIIFMNNREHNNNINRQHKLKNKELFNQVIYDINCKFDYSNNWGLEEEIILSTPSEVLKKIKNENSASDQLEGFFDDSDEEY